MAWTKDRTPWPEVVQGLLLHGGDVIATGCEKVLDKNATLPSTHIKPDVRKSLAFFCLLGALCSSKASMFVLPTKQERTLMKRKQCSGRPHDGDEPQRPRRSEPRLRPSRRHADTPGCHRRLIPHEKRPRHPSPGAPARSPFPHSARDTHGARPCTA